jgi:hypothetical protein
MDERSLLDDRRIEYDDLAVALFICAFVGVAALTVWVVGSAAQTFAAPVFVAGALTGAAVVGAWILGYPRRTAIPAMALVALIAMLVMPAFFDMDGALLREGVGAPASRVYVAMGLYVGGLGVAFLAFLVFGFFGPLAGAVMAARRRDKHARETLVLHCALTFVALALVFFSRASP